MYNLIKYSDNHSKTSGSLWQYYKDEPNDNLAYSESFKSKVKITGKTPDDGNTKDVEIIVPLKYLSNYWRTPEIPPINCKVNLWKFKIAETKFYIPVVVLSTQVIDAGPRAIQQIHSTANLDRDGNATMSFVIEEAKETVLDFSSVI